MPQTMVMLLVAGLKWPVLSSLLGVGWLGFRGIYAYGYIYGKAKNGGGRRVGTIFWAFQAALWGMCGVMGWNLITTGSI
jgi:glutathione S-transferase